MSIVLLAEERPVARKPHGCNACGGIIGVGDRYLRQRCKYDDVYVWKAHRLCEVAGWVCWREMELLDDEGPDWDDTQEVVGRFFAALSGVLSGFGLGSEALMAVER